MYKNFFTSDLDYKDITATARNCSPEGELGVGCYHIPDLFHNITTCFCDTDLCNGGKEEGSYVIEKGIDEIPQTNSCPRGYTPYFVLPIAAMWLYW